MDMCHNACTALGEGIAQWIFIGASLAFGWWNRRQAVAARAENTQLKASLKPPPPVPVVHFQGGDARGALLASLLPPKPSDYNPTYEPSLDTSPETPSAKDEAGRA